SESVMTDFTINVEAYGTFADFTVEPLVWCQEGREGLRKRVNWSASAMWAAGAVILVVLTSSQFAYSSDVVLLRAVGEPSSEQHELELATQFYGLTLKVITPNGAVDADLLHPIQQSETV